MECQFCAQDARSNVLRAVIFAGRADLSEVCIFFSRNWAENSRSPGVTRCFQVPSKSLPWYISNFVMLSIAFRSFHSSSGLNTPEQQPPGCGHECVRGKLYRGNRSKKLETCLNPSGTMPISISSQSPSSHNHCNCQRERNTWVSN